MLTRHQAPGCGGGSTVDAAEGVCDALTPVDTAAAAAHTHAQREPACCYVARGPSSRLQAAVGAALLTLLREAVTHTHPLTLPLTLPLLLHAHTRNGSLHAAMLLRDQAAGSRLRWGQHG